MSFKLVRLYIVVVAMIGAAGLVGATTESTLPWLLRLTAWGSLMVLPGAALYLLIANRPTVVEGAMTALVASPVIIATLATMAMVAGASGATATVVVVGAAVLLGLAGALRARGVSAGIDRRSAALLVGFALLVVVATGYLPWVREWWRVRADAWFHWGVVAQIDDFGLPPKDPYFAGIPLQYMWFYHVLLLVLSRATHTDPFPMMAAVNVHALAALVPAVFCLAAVFRERLSHRFAATVMVVLGFNAAFWVFLPVKVIKAFIGEVRGMEELARTFTLKPPHYDTAYGFMNIYYNQEFFLDKYMVGTAFGLALTLMTAAWYALSEHYKSRRTIASALLAVTLVGMLGFHPLVGFVMIAGIGGGVLLLHLARGRVDGYSVRDSIVVLAVALGCLLAMSPYLYAVMHLKEREQLFPLNLSFKKTAGIVISCALVLVLAWRQRSFWTDRSAAARSFTFTSASLVAFCLLITLPGPNTYDKLGYFVFLPFAVVAGFSLADLVARPATRARRVAVATLWTVLFLVPVNAIALVSCYLTPDHVEVTTEEARLSAWVRANTSRQALFLDDDDKVFLLVSGPRQYVWGRLPYAHQWGYPKLEMSRRYHARRTIYSDRALDSVTLEVLGEASAPLYVIVRPEHRSPILNINAHPELFASVYDDGEMALIRVDTDACRRAAQGAPTVSDEELLRESGL